MNNGTLQGEGQANQPATLDGVETLSNKILTQLRLLIGGFKAIFTHANTADRTYTLPNYDGTIATLDGVETLTNKKFDDGVVINETGADADTRIESDTDANNFFSDGGNNNVGFGTGTPDASLKIDVVSTSKAARPAPSMTTTQRDAISSPVEGALAYLNDQNDFSFYVGGWKPIRHYLHSQLLVPFFKHTITTGNPLAWTSDTVQSWGGEWNQSASAINDRVDYTVALMTGVYQVQFLAFQGAGSGIATLKWNGTTISSHDLYAAASTNNVRITSSNFNVSEPDTGTFTLEVASKNASSVSYTARISWYQFIRVSNYP